MQPKPNGGCLEYTQITLHHNRVLLRRNNGTNLRVFPTLKNASNEEPINFKLYERVKRSKRMQMLRLPQQQNFFLQGEFFCTIKNNPVQQKPKNQLFQVKPIPPLERQQLSKIFKKQNTHIKQPSILTKKDSTIKLNQSQTKQKAPPSPHSIAPRKTPHIYNTLQSNFKPERPVKLKSTNKNKSLTDLTLIETDKQKQLLYLDKKQLAKIKAESFIVMEHPSNKILTGNRYKNQAQIASLTKIMTFYTIYRIAKQQNIDLAKEIVTVCDLASNMSGTTAELVVGDRLSVEQLLYGLMLPSGNDAAVSLAEWGGKISAIDPEQQPQNAFTRVMNKYSKQLDLKQSSFGNPHGLPDFRNTSTPYDLALLIAACLEIPLFNKVISTKVYKLWVQNEGGKKELIWQNTNKLLRREGFIGVKTGVTVTAGPCLATCYQQGDKKFIVVLLRTNKLSRRFKETRLILGWTLRKYNHDAYAESVRKMLKHDAVFDSDNSEDEQEFNYNCLDTAELIKRNKILMNEL